MVSDIHWGSWSVMCCQDEGWGSGCWTPGPCSPDPWGVAWANFLTSPRFPGWREGDHLCPVLGCKDYRDHLRGDLGVVFLLELAILTKEGACPLTTAVLTSAAGPSACPSGRPAHCPHRAQSTGRRGLRSAGGTSVPTPHSPLQ